MDTIIHASTIRPFLWLLAGFSVNAEGALSYPLEGVNAGPVKHIIRSVGLG